MLEEGGVDMSLAGGEEVGVDVVCVGGWAGGQVRWYKTKAHDVMKELELPVCFMGIVLIFKMITRSSFDDSRRNCRYNLELRYMEIYTKE